MKCRRGDKFDKERELISILIRRISSDEILEPMTTTYRRLPISSNCFATYNCYNVSLILLIDNPDGDIIDVLNYNRQDGLYTCTCTEQELDAILRLVTSRFPLDALAAIG